MTTEALLVDLVMRTVREQFADRLGTGLLTRETRLEEQLGADATEREFLGLALEDETGLALDLDAMRAWRTVGDAVDACLAQLG